MNETMNIEEQHSTSTLFKVMQILTDEYLLSTLFFAGLLLWTYWIDSQRHKKRSNGLAMLFEPLVRQLLGIMIGVIVFKLLFVILSVILMYWTEGNMALVFYLIPKFGIFFTFFIALVDILLILLSVIRCTSRKEFHIAITCVICLSFVRWLLVITFLKQDLGDVVKNIINTWSGFFARLCVVFATFSAEDIYNGILNILADLKIISIETFRAYFEKVGDLDVVERWQKEFTLVSGSMPSNNK